MSQTRSAAELARGRHAGRQFCCPGWAAMEADGGYSPIQAEFGPWPDYPFLGYFVQHTAYYRHSELTSGVEQIPIGDRIAVCPWCRSERPGATERYQ